MFNLSFDQSSISIEYESQNKNKKQYLPFCIYNDGNVHQFIHDKGNLVKVIFLLFPLFYPFPF